jgi:hypothetical protein
MYCKFPPGFENFVACDITITTSKGETTLNNISWTKSKYACGRIRVSGTFTSEIPLDFDLNERNSIIEIEYIDEGGSHIYVLLKGVKFTTLSPEIATFVALSIRVMEVK